MSFTHEVPTEYTKKKKKSSRSKSNKNTKRKPKKFQTHLFDPFTLLRKCSKTRFEKQNCQHHRSVNSIQNVSLVC